MIPGHLAALAQATSTGFGSTDAALIAVIFVLFLLLVFLAAGETALVRMSPVRALALQEEGHRGAHRLVRVTSDLPRVINSILLLVTFAQSFMSVLFGVVVSRHLPGWGFTAAVFAFATVQFIYAEAVPKTIALQATDRVALAVAGPISVLIIPVNGLAKLFVRIANASVPGKLEAGPFVTERELRSYAEIAEKEGEIESAERDLIHSIFEFGDTVVREVMVPRPDIVALPATASVAEVVDTILAQGFSRIPVYEDSTDNITGIVYAKDILRILGDKNPTDVRAIDVARDPYFVPETKRVADLLRDMRERKVHICIVIDEYGGTSGLVTIEDLLEEIVGEIADEYDVDEEDVQVLPDGAYIVDGGLDIDDVNELLDANLPEGDWDTIAGYVLDLFGRVPTVGEEITSGDVVYEVREVDNRRISKLRICRLPRPQPEEPAAADTEAG